MMRFAFLLPLTLAFMPNGMGARTDDSPWVQVAESNDGPVFIDTRFIVREGSRVTAWYRTDLRRLGARGESEWLNQREIDCAAGTMRMLASVGRLPDSSLIDPDDRPEPPEPIRADTIGAAMRDYVCR
jgi:hypothetical protein